MEINKKQKTLLGTVAVAIVLVVMGMIIGNTTLLLNFMLAGGIIIILPFFLYKYAYYSWLKNLENQFPNFVRDLADSKRSGMSFSQSIKLASKSNYGKLTKEVQTMHNKLSWGVPFVRTLDLFQQKVKDSRVMKESLTIIKESYLSGGDIAATLDAIARDIIMLKETEAERASTLKQSVMIMYAIFFMFLGISIMIIFVMIPMIKNQPTISAGSFGFSFNNPCDGVGFFPCNLFQIIGLLLGVPTGIANYYISIFFLVMVIQGIFTGLIAGQLGQNSVTAGSKHSFVMVLIGIGTFLFLSRAGLLPT